MVVLKTCFVKPVCVAPPLPPQQLSRKMFESLPIPVWRKVLPFIINNMDVHPRRIAFLSTLLSGLPERAQLIGQMVHEGVSAAMWDRLAAEVPAMIPRGLQGHWHMY